MDFGNVRLFNLDFDPGEQFSLHNEYPELVQTMLAQLQATYRQINGPYQKQARYLNPLILDRKAD
jgi:hypothetical protein